MAHSTRGYNSMQGEAGASIHSMSHEASRRVPKRTSRWPPPQSRRSYDATDSSDTDSDSDAFFNNRSHSRQTPQSSSTSGMVTPPLASRASVEVIDYSMLKLALSPWTASQKQHEATHSALFTAARDMMEGTPPFEDDEPLPRRVPTLEIGRSYDFESTHTRRPDVAFGVVHAIEQSITTFASFPELNISVVDSLDCTDAFSACVSERIVRQSVPSDPTTIQTLTWSGSYLSCALCLRVVPALTSLALQLSVDVGPHLCRTLFMLCPQLEIAKITRGVSDDVVGASGEICEDLKNSMSHFPPVEAHVLNELEVTGSGVLLFLQGVITPKLRSLTIQRGREALTEFGDVELVDSILSMGIRSRLSRLTIENPRNLQAFKGVVSSKLSLQLKKGTKGDEEDVERRIAVFVS